MSNVETFLCALIRGESPLWPDDADDRFATSLIERAQYHGVLPLIHSHIQRSDALANRCPAAVVQACREAALGQAMWELRHRDLLNQVLTNLAGLGLRPVLFKGTALAYGLYPEGELRSRGDTDLIIPPGTLPQVDKALKALGFKRQMGISGEFVSYQGSYTRTQQGGESHTLDVHWRINNSELLSRLFTHQELLERASPLPQLSPYALAASPVHALLIACMHRATHKENPYYVDGAAYYSGDRQIWLYDIHLLLIALTPAQFDEFLTMVEAKGLRAVCQEGIERAQGCFHTRVPEAVAEALNRPNSAGAPDRYLASSHLRQQWMDFVALGNMRHRAAFVREVLFPSAEYMRSKYPKAHPNFLVPLYLKRAWGGLFKHLLRNEH